MASACKAKAQLADASVGPEMETMGLRLGEAAKKNIEMASGARSFPWGGGWQGTGFRRSEVMGLWFSDLGLGAFGV